MNRSHLLSVLAVVLPLVGTALPANAQNDRGYGNGQGTVAAVRCESNDNRQQVCNTGWRDAIIVRQLSKTRCTEGQNWGTRNGSVWVSNGCRADFGPGRGGNNWNDNNQGGWNGNGNGNGNGATIRCESNDNRQRVCNTGWRNATLVRQLSNSQCVEGRSWGSSNGNVWVSNGCRAEFAEGRRGNGWGNGNGNGNGHGGNWNGQSNNNYSVECSSDSNRMRSCNWDRRQGRPTVVQQLSSTQCIEGRNWGYNGDSLWVNGGCRARFGNR